MSGRLVDWQKDKAIYWVITKRFEEGVWLYGMEVNGEFYFDDSLHDMIEKVHKALLPFKYEEYC